MKSKTSLFKASLIRKNFLRFWPIALVYFIILFFTLPFAANTALNSDWMPAFERINSFVNLLQTAQNPVLTAVFALAAALLCFSYLFSSRSCNMMHAFPLKRSQLFASNYISGILLLLVPQLIALMITLPRIAGLKLTWLILPWLLYSFGTSFVFYTIGVFCCMLAGHAFAAIVYYAFFNCAEALIVLLYRFFAKKAVYGLSGLADFGNINHFFLSPLVYITMGCRLELTPGEAAASGDPTVGSIAYIGMPAIGFFCIAAAVLLAVTMLLYRRRALETAGEMSAFAFVRPLMRWTIAFGVGTAMAFLITAMTNRSSRFGILLFIIIFIIFALLAFMFTEMILKKSFRIFRRSFVIEALACAAVFTGIFLFLHNDPANLLNRVPDTGKIRTASVTGSYTIVKNDQAGIDRIRDLQQSILDHRSEYEAFEKSLYNDDREYTPAATLYFDYTTESGNLISRSYTVPADEAAMSDPENCIAKLNVLEDDPQAVCDCIFGINSDDILWTDGSFRETEFDGKVAEQLYKAYKKDILEGNVPYLTGDPDLFTGFRYYFPIALNGTVSPELKTVFSENGLTRGYGWGGSSGISPVWTYTDSTRPGETSVMSSFYLSETCTNTIEALTKAGLISGPEDLERILHEDNAMIKA